VRLGEAFPPQARRAELNSPFEDLITNLPGDVHAPAPERKKNELVEQLATLFADACAGTLPDEKLAAKVNVAAGRSSLRQPHSYSRQHGNRPRRFPLLSHVLACTSPNYADSPADMNVSIIASTHQDA